MARKWATLKRDPFGSIGSRLGILSVALSLNRKRNRRILETAGVQRYLSGRPTSAYPPHYGDIGFLYLLVRKRRPSLVLEFGSGVSTSVIAMALKHNAEEETTTAGKLISVESEEYWAKQNSKAMHADLADYVEIVYAPAVETHHEGEGALRHEGVPEGTYDMVYLDGPDFRPPEFMLSMDLLALEYSLADNVIGVIDGRHINADFLKRHFKQPFRFKYQAVPGVYTFERVR
jgi:predicted O-methyltransferase YrrM